MKTFRRCHIMLAMCLCLSLMVSCATLQSPGVANPTSAPTAMPPEQQITIWMDLYTSQYKDVKNVLTSTTATPEQRQIAVAKRKVLVDVWPLLSTYRDLVDAKGVPTQTQTDAIVELINKLPSAIGGH